MAAKQSKNTNNPNLRFPGFEQEWEKKKLGEIMEFKNTNSFSRENLNYESGNVKNIHYGDIHTKFQTLFDINQEQVPFISTEISLDRIAEENYCKEGDIVFADASEDLNDIGKSIEIVNLNSERILAGLHTLLARPKTNTFYIGFNGFLLKSNAVRLQIQKEAQGSKVLGISIGRISKIEICFPALNEQQKIASFLQLIDSRIETQKKIIEELIVLKSTIAKKIFLQEIRFKDNNGDDFADWKEKKLRDMLRYEQPTKYLVLSTEYNNAFTTPVITAGKTFILGYTNEIDGIFNKENLPVIIFDDFTTSSKYVEFPFKVKSSALKILSSINSNNIKFIYESMQMIQYEIGGHERHWISIFSELRIFVPCIQEQNKIANFLSSIDSKIEIEKHFLGKLEEQKKFLLQNLFI